MRLYDEIADIYHLIYSRDWADVIRRHSAILDGILRHRLGDGPHRILDVTCGVGTQARGLAALGHDMTGSDLSRVAIERARREAREQGLDIAYSVADMRECDRHHPGTFDAVISCDNAITHLMTVEEIRDAFGAFRRSTRPGGVVLLTVRDYAVVQRSTAPQLHGFGVRETPEGRLAVYQIWDWDADGERYDFALHFVLDRRDGPPEVRVSRGRYHAIGIDDLMALLGDAGFVDVERIDGEYPQPVLLGRAPPD